MAYAKGTSVTVEKSRCEIELIVIRHGATAFTYAVRIDKAMIQFEAKDRVVRFILPLPTVSDKAFANKKISKYQTRRSTDVERQKMCEQACREKWRALRIAILAKLESIESGIEQFDEAFFSQIVDPSTNKTLYESLQVQLAMNYAEPGRAPLALPAPDEFIEGEIVK